MIFCPHIPQPTREAMENQYSEEFKRYIIGVDCGKCPSWFSGINAAAKAHFEKNGITSESIQIADSYRLISFDLMEYLLKEVNRVGVAA